MLLLIVSQPGAPKVTNLRGNPKVALHLELDDAAEDGGVLSIEGLARVEPGPLEGPARSAYVEKYLAAMRGEGLTPEQALAEFSTVIRVTPTHVRSY